MTFPGPCGSGRSLLGRRAWWLPRWLDRLLPNLHVEGHEITDDEFTLRNAVVGQRTSSDELSGSEVRG